MRSVVSEIQTEEFVRIRVGIGKPERKEEMISYVIGKMPAEDMKILGEAIKKASQAIKIILKEGIEKAMNQIN